MNLKSNYKNEIISKSIVVVTTIFCIVLLISGIMAIIQLINEKNEMYILIIVGLLFLGIPVLFLYLIYKIAYDTKINQENAKKIMENGIKVQGRIVDMRIERVDMSTTEKGIRHKYYYHIIVEYTNNAQTFTIESPRLNFHPDYLTSKDVDVYLYEDDFYIDNFKLDLERMEADRKRRINTNVIVILLFILLGIINAIIIFLTINGVISSELGQKLSMSSIFISAIIAAVACVINCIKNIIKMNKD